MASCRDTCFCAGAPYFQTNSLKRGAKKGKNQTLVNDNDGKGALKKLRCDVGVGKLVRSW